MAASEPSHQLPMLGCVALLAAGDVGATAAFYRDKLGFEVTDEWPGLWVRLRRGSLVVEVEQSDAIRRIGPCEKGGVVFRVADVDAWCAELKRRGPGSTRGR